MEQFNRHIKVSHRVVFPLELRLFNTVIIFFFFNILYMDLFLLLIIVGVFILFQ